MPRGKLREIFGTCDVVKKIGKTRKEASLNAKDAEDEILAKFNEKLRRDEMEAPISDPNTTQIKEQNNKAELSPCIANNAERSKFEQFKADSLYLKEPLNIELANEVDHFTNDAVQLLKFHGSYQQDDREHRKRGGKGKDWQMMLRLRNPGGYVPGELFIALDDLSDKLGNGTLRATVRQCFQIHGIRKENIKEVIGTIIKSLGSTLGACGDINRNVMAPAAPYQSGGYPSARKLAQEIADLLAPKTAEETYLDLWVDGDLSYKIKGSKNVKAVAKKQLEKNLYSGDKNEPLYGRTYMPRKFKCAVTVPGDNSVDLLTNDIGLVVFCNSKGALQGCNVYVGGGMGRTHNLESTFARVADPIGYVEADHVLPLVQAILALQRDCGDRKTRRHSRLKYVLHDMGKEWFINELNKKYFKKQIHPLRKEPKSILEDYLGWHKQSKALWFVGIPVLSGRLSGQIKKGLRKIIETYKLEVRLTPNQDILLCNIGSIQKSSVIKQLKQIGIENPETTSPLARHALACPALPLCGLAMTEAERTLPEIIKRVEDQLKSLEIAKSILIRVTGCPNGCARPYMAELALVGSGMNQYQLWLGGSSNLERLAKPYLSKMPINEMEKILEPLFMHWKEEGRKLGFGDHINELGEEKVLSLLE